MNLLNSVFILTASFNFVYLITEYILVFLHNYIIRYKYYRYLLTVTNGRLDLPFFTPLD